RFDRHGCLHRLRLSSTVLLLATQGRVQCAHSLLDFLCVTACRRSVQSARSLQNALIVRIELGIGTFSFAALACKSVVDGLAKCLPQFLFVFALQRHRMGFGLPALL